MVNRNAARHLLLVASILLCFFVYIGYRLRSPSDPEPRDAAAFAPEYIQVDDEPAPLRPQTAAPAGVPGDEGLGGWVPSVPGGSSSSPTPPPAALPVAPPSGASPASVSDAPSGAITGLIPAPPSGGGDSALSASPPAPPPSGGVTGSADAMNAGMDADAASPFLPPFMADSDNSAASAEPPSRSPFLPPPNDGFEAYGSDSSATAAADEPLMTPSSGSAAGGEGATASLMRPPADPVAAAPSQPDDPDEDPDGTEDYSYQSGYEGDLETGSQTLRMYIVRTGDTLSNIAARELGSISLADNIFLLNRDVIEDPDSLTVGAKIRLPVRDGFMTDSAAAPAVSSAQAETGAGAARRPNQGIGRTHIVRRGDTLSSIALEYYGASSGWRFLYEANKTIVPNPNQLSVGTELTVPPYEN